MAGFYGIEPTDVQYGMILTYASGVTFLALDFRIIKYFFAKKYLLWALSMNMISSLICFYTKNWGVFLICGFIQGSVCAILCSITLNMVFPRLDSVRSRVIGFTIFYGGLQISIPFYAIYSSIVLHFFDFNWLFYCLNIMLIIIITVVVITMNSKSRFQKKMPLYQLDWTGYLFYTAFCMMLGYILVYGQQLNWFSSSLIGFLTLSCIVSLFLFVLRETRLKRPLINLQIFKTPNFIIGLLLLFVFYIFKGTTGLTYGYLESILKTDPLHVIPIWAAVILGTSISMFVTARFILTGTRLMRIIIFGFVLMALYYIYMLAFISVTGETADFIFPLFTYGIATGALFVPIVVFTASAVPAKIAVNASFLGIFARFVGFSTSMAFNNYVQLYTRSAVREKVRESINETNPQFSATLQNIQNTYLNAGSDIYMSRAGADAYFNNMIREQILARATRDYYSIMLIGLVVLIIILAFLPKIQHTILKLNKRNIPY